MIGGDRLDPIQPVSQLQADCNVAAQSPWVVGISESYEKAAHRAARFRWAFDSGPLSVLPLGVQFAAHDVAEYALGVPAKRERLTAVLAQTGLYSFSPDNRRYDPDLAAQSIHIADYH